MRSPDGTSGRKLTDVLFEETKANVMASPLDEVTKLLAGLSMGGNSIKTLESLVIVVSTVPAGELQSYAPKIDIDRIFTCLSTSDKYGGVIFSVFLSVYF